MRPTEKAYREEYDRDATNQKKQTWDQYWGWVKSFHEGSFFVSGWTDRAKELVDGVKAGPERKKLVKEVNEFGKDVCKEWAKDSSVCKVGTSNLTRWGKMVEKAKKADAGDGRGARAGDCKHQGRVQEEGQAARGNSPGETIRPDGSRVLSTRSRRDCEDVGRHSY